MPAGSYDPDSGSSAVPYDRPRSSMRLTIQATSSRQTRFASGASCDAILERSGDEGGQRTQEAQPGNVLRGRIIEMKKRRACVIKASDAMVAGEQREGNIIIDRSLRAWEDVMKHRAIRPVSVALVVVTTLLLSVAPRHIAAQGQRSPVILSTTSSTQDSGLLDVLVPMFERQSGYTVKTVAVGTGQALALGARGEADVVLAHAPELEKKYVAEGKMLNRRLVMYNDFVIIGPANDPAGIKGMTAAHAMKAIARTGSRFVSRGDNSGTHILEKSLWKLAGIEPSAPWYIEAGQGMGLALGLADDRNAYTITDRGTYLAYQKRLRLPILLQGDRPLLNIYSVMDVNRANGPKVNTTGGKAFAEFMVAPETQNVIKTFGVDKYGEALFVPIAGMREDQIGKKP
jgi:tungstate transport system substrate-binding protein